MNETIKETIGCDLGDRQSELCILTGSGTEQVLTRPKAVKTTQAGVRGFFEGRARAHVVIEVGTHSRWVSELLEELGHQVTVANPRKVKLIKTWVDDRGGAVKPMAPNLYRAIIDEAHKQNLRVAVGVINRRERSSIGFRLELRVHASPPTVAPTEMPPSTSNSWPVT